MANYEERLEFPIGFDLDKGIAEASKAWAEGGAEKLEKQIAKRKVGVKLEVGDLKKLEEVGQRLKELRIEPLTEENKKAIKELTGELKELAKGLKGLGNLRGIELPELQRARAAKLNAEAVATGERLRIQQERLRQSQERLTLQQRRAEEQAERTGRAYGRQETYVSRLLKRLSVYASFSAGVGFLKSLKDVTAEFELQRVSLGAILQDAAKGELLFGKLKALAVESPESLMNLTRYTKQLAAYKIGYEDLFDTTKRLTDISVGLGVAMDRVVLAYGQTRATGYLRASEIRQFTEMGIPITEELAKKLSAVNGELVTAAQVMDMVSKRMISFDMVNDVITDMTSKGGMFYNIQEKQTNTLYGLYQKVGDSYQIMLDKMGQTDGINAALRGIGESLLFIMDNWVTFLSSITTAGLVAALGAKSGDLRARAKTNKAAKIKAEEAATKRAAAAKKQLEKADLALTAAENKLAQAMRNGNSASVASAQAARDRAAANQAAAQQNLAAAQKEEKAARRSNRFTAGGRFLGTAQQAGLSFLSGLKSIFSMGIWGAIAGAVSGVVAHWVQASQEARRLRKEITATYEEGVKTGADSARNFEKLANAAVKAADGSKKQREALAELNRTYGDILPSQALQIENLRAMNGEYSSLTSQIREYMMLQAKQRAQSAVEEAYASKIKDAREESVRDWKTLIEQRQNAGFINKKISAESLATDIVLELEIAASAGEKIDKDRVKRILKDQIKSIGDETLETLVNAAFSDVDDHWFDDIPLKIVETIESYQKDLKHVDATFDKAAGGMGKFTAAFNDLREAVAEANTVEGKLEAIRKAMTYRSSEARISDDAAREMFNNANDLITLFDEAMWKKIYESAGNSGALQTYYKNVYNMLSDLYGVSSDETHRAIRNIASEVSQELFGEDRVGFYGILDTENEAAYVKRLKEEKEKLENETKRELETRLKEVRAHGADDKATLKAIQRADDDIKLIQGILARLNNYDTDKKGRGYTEPAWLTMLKSRRRFIEDFQREVSELGKTMAAEEALLQTQERMLGRGKELGIDVMGLDGTEGELLAEYGKMIDEVKARLEELDGVAFKNIGGMTIAEILGTGTKNREAVALVKYLGDLHRGVTEFTYKKAKEGMEAALKGLAEEVSRGKEAKGLYDAILQSTGDGDLAEMVAEGVYGELGKGGVARKLYEAQAAQVRELFKGKSYDTEISLEGVFDDRAMAINWGRLSAIYDEHREDLIEKNRETARQIVKTGQAESAARWKQWAKDLEKAQTFADRRIELSRQTANEIAAIESRKAMLDKGAEGYAADAARYDSLIEGYRERERKLAEEMEFEAEKEGGLYVELFGDLEGASEAALKMLKARLEGLRGAWQHLDADKVKELTERMEELDKQIAKRNPLKALVGAVKEYIALRKEGRTQREDEEAAVKAAEARAAAYEEMMAAEKEWQRLKAAADGMSGEGEDEVKAKALADAARAAADAARVEAEEKKEAYEAAVKTEETAAAQLKTWGKMGGKMGGAIEAVNKKIDDWQGAMNDAADSVREVMELFGSSDAELEFFDNIMEGTNKTLDGVQGIADALGKFASGDVVGGILSLVSAGANLIIGIFGLGNAGAVKAAAEAIEEQERRLERLERAYERLQVAAEDAFGGEWIANYNSQIAILEAQLDAYRKQLKAERSKGKEADEDAIDDYRDKVRETADAIRDMEGSVSEKMLGTDLTSAARAFAEAWLEAYKTFGSTADAMEAKFDEMLDNMIVNALLGRVMEQALAPVFEQIDGMGGEDWRSARFWRELEGTMSAAKEHADAGAKAVMAVAESAGMKVREMGGESTGISKSVGSASSEEVNALAAGINTQNYYVSYIPQIYSLLQSMSGGGSNASGGSDTSLQAQAMQHYAAIEANTAGTLRELQGLALLLGRVIKYKGGEWRVNTNV